MPAGGETAFLAGRNTRFLPLFCSTRQTAQKFVPLREARGREIDIQFDNFCHVGRDRT